MADASIGCGRGTAPFVLMITSRRAGGRARIARPTALVGGLALAATLAACAEPPSVSDAGDAAARFASAVAGGDGAAACALLTPRALDAVAGASDEQCEDLITNLDETADSAADIQAWGDAARVTIGADTLFLFRLADGWRVDAAGCTPAAQGTYECTVEG